MRDEEDIPNIPEYVSVKEAAAILHISEKTIYYYVENRRLPAVRAADVILIPVKGLESFEQKSVGRPRKTTPSWRISTKDNALIVTSIEVQVRPGQQETLMQRLAEIRRNGEDDFPGTVARYVLEKEVSPETLEFLLIWKVSVMPAEADRKKALEAFKQKLADMLDWSTAQERTEKVFMHA